MNLTVNSLRRTRDWNVRTMQETINRLPGVKGGDIVLLQDSERTLRPRRMDEKRFYDEKEETKQIPMVCPHCRTESTFPIRWMVRTKKSQIPGGANDQDRHQFTKARSYMVRIDNMVACRNIKCRKRFELTGQTVFLI